MLWSYSDLRLGTLYSVFISTVVVIIMQWPINYIFLSGWSIDESFKQEWMDPSTRLLESGAFNSCIHGIREEGVGLDISSTLTS